MIKRLKMKYDYAGKLMPQLKKPTDEERVNKSLDGNIFSSLSKHLESPTTKLRQSLNLEYYRREDLLSEMHMMSSIRPMVSRGNR